VSKSERERDLRCGVCVKDTRKVDVRLPAKGNSNSHGATPVHQLISMIKWIRTSRLSIKNSIFEQDSLQLVAITAILIASKHEELAPQVPSILNPKRV